MGGEPAMTIRGYPQKHEWYYTLRNLGAITMAGHLSDPSSGPGIRLVPIDFQLRTALTIWTGVITLHVIDSESKLTRGHNLHLELGHAHPDCQVT